MCGFAGILSQDPRVRGRVQSMADSIRHRGPDGEGFISDDKISLAHCRLSIMDLPGGGQPMRSADGSTFVVFNGEIFNYPLLRRRLERQGFRFRTRCDTEVLLHLYARDGLDLVHSLDGMYAVAIWDGARERLLLARDHLGQKPLFYLRARNSFAFASEVKALLASGLVEPIPDLEALYHYLSMRYVPGDHSFFRGIRKLEAGHRLVLESGSVQTDRYWDFSFDDPLPGNEPELLDALDATLSEAVQSHLMSDVTLGAFLSGGIDSSLVTAIAARESGERIPTFAIGVKEASFNELPYARVVADHCGTDHHESVVSANLVWNVPEMVWQMDEPADPFGVGIYLASRLAAENVKTVLSGDGGDELFAGYDRFAGQRLAALFSHVPSAVRRNVLRPAIDALPESFAYKGLSQKLRWVNDLSLAEGPSRYAQSLSYLRFTEEAKQSLFTGPALREMGALDSRELIAEQFLRAGTSDEVHRMLYADLHTRIPDHLLTVVDRMSMAHGLEVRAPLLEHRVVEFAARIPSEWKLRGLTLKYLLRQLARRYLPPRIVERRKQGFAFPVAVWLQNDLGPLVDAAIETSRYVDRGIFQREHLRRLSQEHRSGGRDHNYRLWLILNLEIWHRLFIEGNSTDTVREWMAGAVPPDSRTKLLSDHQLAEAV
jgi:asparagine synthase (glutamine-hydrolysing)